MLASAAKTKPTAPKQFLYSMEILYHYHRMLVHSASLQVPRRHDSQPSAEQREMNFADSELDHDVKSDIQEVSLHRSTPILGKRD
jgi:hypothetical protein